MLGISVVIPCYNAADYLGDAIRSVLQQEYAGPLEILVGDDASTDVSREIARSFGPPVTVLEKPDDAVRGPSAARNRCLRAAIHPLIAFLDADDEYLPGHLAGLADAFAGRPELGLVYNVARVVSDDGNSTWRFPIDSRRAPLTPEALLLDQCFSLDSVMVRKATLDAVGIFDEGLVFGEDQDLWLRCFEAFPAAHLPVCGSVYRMHGDQATKNLALWQQGEWVLARAVARYPYSRRVVRKRRAVLAYRMALAAQQARRPVVAMMFFAKAGVLDPLRAIQEMGRRAAAMSRRATRFTRRVRRQPTVF